MLYYRAGQSVKTKVNCLIIHFIFQIMPEGQRAQAAPAPRRNLLQRAGSAVRNFFRRR